MYMYMYMYMYMLYMYMYMLYMYMYMYMYMLYMYTCTCMLGHTTRTNSFRSVASIGNVVLAQSHGGRLRDGQLAVAAGKRRAEAVAQAPRLHKKGRNTRT